MRKSSTCHLSPIRLILAYLCNHQWGVRREQARHKIPAENGMGDSQSHQKQGYANTVHDPRLDDQVVGAASAILRHDRAALCVVVGGVYG
jgi:hypothetical protein